MPELPEVEATRLGIEPYVRHQRIKKIIVRERRLRWEITPGLEDILCGEKIASLERRSKYLLFKTHKGCLLVHFGMSGKFKLLFLEGKKILPSPKKHEHMDLIFANGACLRLIDPRKFGCVLWIENPAQHALLKSIGPEPLERVFTAAYLFKKTRSRKAAIKDFLMNAKNVAGIGNIYAVEALFLAGIHPQRKSQTLALSECKRLVSAIKSVLKAAIKKGGTTFRDFAQAGGEPGYFAQKLNVYDRAGQACRKCKTILKGIKQGQRSSVFCPKCQG